MSHGPTCFVLLFPLNSPCHDFFLKYESIQIFLEKRSTFYFLGSHANSSIFFCPLPMALCFMLLNSICFSDSPVILSKEKPLCLEAICYAVNETDYMKKLVGFIWLSEVWTKAEQHGQGWPSNTTQTSQYNPRKMLSSSCNWAKLYTLWLVLPLCKMGKMKVPSWLSWDFSCKQPLLSEMETPLGLSFHLLFAPN